MTPLPETRAILVVCTDLRGHRILHTDALDQTVIFVEVQFQRDEYLYDRMFAEIGMYLAQNHGVEDWRAMAEGRS